MPNDTRPPAGDPEARGLLMVALGMNGDVNEWPLDVLCKRVQQLRHDNADLCVQVARLRKDIVNVTKGFGGVAADLPG